MSLFGPSKSTIREATVEALARHSDWRTEDVIKIRTESGSFIRKSKPYEKIIFKKPNIFIGTSSDFPLPDTDSAYEKVWIQDEEEVPYTCKYTDRFNRQSGRYLGSEKIFSFEGKGYLTYVTSDIPNLTETEIKECRR